MIRHVIMIRGPPMIRTTRRLDSFLYEAAQNFEVFSFRYSKIRRKKNTHKADDVLFKAYPIVPVSCRSNLVVRYL
jgi:hypothetical protein